jgi:hypothetical protein
MKNLFIVIIFLFPIFISAQKILTGKVTDEKNNPIANASVFLSNTSIGTKADDDGSFEISIPNGRFNLVVSSIGFQTLLQEIHSADLPILLHIRLKIKTEELENLVIEPFEKNGWEKWGLFFTQNFIGTTSQATTCRILNKEVIKFRHSKSTNKLTAIATEPIVIENKALGYTITLQLENFSYDFKTRYLIYIGYAYFKEMKGSASKIKKWKKERNDAYYGSIMHFMRSLFRNRIMEEGFQVRHLKKIVNLEKQRIKALNFRNASGTPGGIFVSGRTNSDSAEYYDKVLAQEDEFNEIGKNLLPGDSIAFAVDSTTAGLEFADHLLVIYGKKSAPKEYTIQYPKNSTAMMSQITLVNGNPLHVEVNGNFYDPGDLLSSGYWAWSEKISLLLPYDFKPD